MNGVTNLHSGDFELKSGNRGSIMCHRIQGISLVLFYSTQCEHCPELIKLFNKLPGTIGGCIFAFINISKNKKCVELSHKTIVPIEYVPLIILYVDGKPYLEYKGERNLDNIKNFIIEVANNIYKNRSFTQGTVKETSRIPEYTIGKPLIGKDKKVCYLEFNKAYYGK